jgi:hypothetical protein
VYKQRVISTSQGLPDYSREMGEVANAGENRLGYLILTVEEASAKSQKDQFTWELAGSQQSLFEAFVKGRSGSPLKPWETSAQFSSCVRGSSGSLMSLTGTQPSQSLQLS